MLALVAIFLVTLIASTTAVWLYRQVSGWHGFTRTLVGRPGSSTRMKIGLQQGFISLRSNSTKQARYVKLRGPRGAIKTPWGW